MPTRTGRRPFDARRLERQLHRQYAEISTRERQRAVQPFVRVTERGRILTCTPSQQEYRDNPTPHSAGKVIYDTVADAESARRALAKLGVGPLRIYECDRSRSGHCHLTSKLRA